MPKIDRDSLVSDVQWHIRMSGVREQAVKSTRLALQQVLSVDHLFICLLNPSRCGMKSHV